MYRFGEVLSLVVVLLVVACVAVGVFGIIGGWDAVQPVAAALNHVWGGLLWA